VDSRNAESIHTQEPLPAASFELRWVHAQGQHSLHARLFLAGRNGLPRGIENRREVCSPPGQRQQVKFQQDRFRVRFTGLPAEAPDQPVTTIAIDCESETSARYRFRAPRTPRNNV